MIYCPGQFLFLHIPRTSGMSIKHLILHQAIECNLADGLLFNTTDYPFECRRHVTLFELHQGGLPIHDQPIVTIMRNPFDIIESFWRLICRDHIVQKKIFAKTWKEFIKRYYEAGFEALINKHFSYLKTGGFYNHFCELNHTHPVTVFQFESLDQQWEELCHQLRISGTRPNANSAPGESRSPWTVETIDQVCSLCAHDIETFRYDIPALSTSL